MKLQNLIVVFIIIVLPIILVLSLYISNGLKTIEYQSYYDKALVSASNDALYAFEKNVANDEFSENPEAKRDILKASVKMFEKSLASASGISAYNAEEIEEYIPAIVFGMYDGFYMYAPSGLYDSTDEKVKDYTHNLKNYVYYSETVQGENGDVTITYSLDNYVTVAGNFGYGYEIKKGYLIRGVDPDDEDFGDNISGEMYAGINISEDDDEAREYYRTAFVFTHWFLRDTGLKDVEINGKTPFNISDTNDPEDPNSTFNQHKRKIIKQKIEGVLNSTITAYSEKTWGQVYKMPKLKEEDWEKIYNNISIISFFQGKEIGLTKYNGYTVVNSTNSEEYVNPSLMYFIGSDGYYHDIRCDKTDELGNKINFEAGYRIGSFSPRKIETETETPVDTDDDGEKDVTTITTQTSYEYKHDELACYNCINGSMSTDVTVYDYIKPVEGSEGDPIKTAYWTSLGRERYDASKITPIDFVLDIKFDANEGVGQEILSGYNKQYDYGVIIQFPSTEDNPTRTHYTFKGWTRKKDGINIVDTTKEKAIVDMTYYAAWQANKYKVIFEWNDESDTPQEIEMDYNTPVKFPSEYTEGAPLRTGYKLLGWSTEDVTTEDGTGTNDDIMTADEMGNEYVPGGDGIKKYYAVWELDTVEITFDYNGGIDSSNPEETSKTIEVINKSSILFPTNIEKEGHTLKGWSTYINAISGTYTANANSKNETYYAIWEKNKYTITFKNNIDGEDKTIGELKNVEYGTKIEDVEFISDPTREGYKFTGWSEERNYIKLEIEEVKNDITYYAIWEANKYIVEFDTNKGSGSTDPNPLTIQNIIVTFDQRYGTLPTVTRIGYTFDGWWTEVSGGVEIKNDTQVKTPNNHTLYAHWIPNNYTLSFNINKGSGSTTPNPATISSITVTFDSTYGTLPTVSRTGYTFAGWWTQASGGTQVSSSTQVTTPNNHTLYAHWTPNNYTLSFNTNKGSGSTTPNPATISSRTVTFDSTYGTLPTVTRTGYTFSGWWTQASGGTKVENNASMTRSENHTLYAHWSPISYTIEYVGTNATGGSMLSSSHTFDVPKKLTLNNYTRTGHTFIGWKDDAGNTYTNEKEVVNLANTQGAVVKLYAQWQVNNYTITLKPQNGQPDETRTAPFGSTVSLPNNLTRSGYSFRGWHTNSSLTSGGVYSVTIPANNTTVFYGIWDPAPTPIAGNQAITATVSNWSGDFTQGGKRGYVDFDLTLSINSHLANNCNEYRISTVFKEKDGDFSDFTVNWNLNASNNWTSTARVRIITGGSLWTTGSTWEGNLVVDAVGSGGTTRLSGESYVCISGICWSIKKNVGIYTTLKSFDVNYSGDKSITRNY